jgi:uncharacterized membrane protein
MAHVSARTVFRYLAAATFVLTGVKHFTSAEAFRAIVPPALPRADVVVAVSGVAEIAGAVGLLVPRLRRAAGWGLIALLIAVFPANIYMAISDDPRVKLGLPQWALWARLPLQAVLIVWVEWASRPTRD